MGRSGASRLGTTNKKKSYIQGMASRQSTLEIEDDTEDEEEVAVVHKCSNSATSFEPPYWTFIFLDMSLREYVCVTVNLPSGLCREDTGLEGRVEAHVSPCRTKLLVTCEWPETMTDSVCMEQALSVRWKQSRKSRGGNSEETGTVFNILHAFDLQLHKIRTQNQLASTSNLGGTATIVLPFQVEPEMVLCETNLDQTIFSVNLYVVLKKVFKIKDKMVNNQMTVKLSNGMEQSSTKTEYTSFKKLSTYKSTTIGGYASSSDSSGPRPSPTKKKLKQLIKIQDADGGFS
jgi:hypothetical protein